MELSSIVQVNITRETRVVSRKGFGTGLALVTGATFSDPVKEYASITEVAEDFATSTAAYKLAARYFGQANPKPEKLFIGKRTTEVAQVLGFTVASAADGVKTITINGVDFSFTASSNTTTQIRDGLLAAIAAGDEPVTGASVSTAQGTITADDAGTPFTYSASAGITLVLSTPNNGVQEDLTAAVAFNNDWYGLLLEARGVNDILLAAESIEAMKKVFSACSADGDIITSADDDVLSVLKGKGYDRTFFTYSADQANYPDAGIVGGQFPKDPGSYTFKFKNIIGVTPDDLSSSETNFVNGKNGNTFQTVAGVNIYQEGKVVSGEWIDTIIGVDWLEARMAERVFATLANADKIPFTDGGITVIEADVRAQLDEAVAVGFLDSYEVTVPNRSETNPADRNNRELKGIRFSGVLAGAVHKTVINGTVSV